MTLAQALIGENIPPRERGRFQGYFAGVFALASTSGPILGAYLTEHISWRSVFAINLPIGLLSLYLLLFRPPFFGAIDAQLALFAFFSACHFSQFVYNLPVLMRGGRVGVAYWPVLKGPMLRIFAIDAVLFVANLVAAILLMPVS